MKKQYFVKYKVWFDRQCTDGVTTVDAEIGHNATKTLDNIINEIKPLYQDGVLITPFEVYVLN